MLRPAVFMLCLCAAGVARSQITDSFSDGTFLKDPAWSGETDRWQIGRLGGSPSLQSHGTAASDTIHLSLETSAAFGRWQFDFAHTGVNLSTFNGARIYLSADAANPDSGVVGYYLQAGTNNTDALSLWRVDGAHSRRRELARSTESWIAGDSSLLHITVDRDAASRWTVRVNGELALEARDARYTVGRYFIVWVKHSPSGARGFFLDELSVMPKPPPQTSPPGPLDIVVNEIQYDPLPGGAEFVELYNRSDRTFDLQRLTLRDSRSPPLELADAPVEFPPDSYAVLVGDAEAFRMQFRQVDFMAPAGWASLNNTGDAVVLEVDDVLVDSVAYEPEASPAGFSLERIDPDGPSDAYNFESSSDPFGATPGARNSVYAPDDIGPSLLFAEQLDDHTLALIFDEPLASPPPSASDVRLGTTTALETRSVTPTEVRASFAMEVATPTVVVSAAADRRGNVSASLSSDIAFQATPGDLVVNEILYEPIADAHDGAPDQVEYVEIVNRSRRILTLSGLFRTRDPDENGDADTLDVGRFQTALDVGGFYLVVTDTSTAPAATAAVRKEAALSLLNDGDRIRLHGGSGAVLDDLAYEPIWHHPDLVDRRGVALERLDLHGPSDDPGNWTSSVAPSGGSPGSINSVRAEPSPRRTTGISVTPNPFTPDRDGHEDVAAISFQLRADVSLIRLRIFGLEGHVVREIVRSDLVGREGTVYWDGLDDLGRGLRIGVYVAVIEAADRERRTVEVHKAPIVVAKRL